MTMGILVQLMNFHFNNAEEGRGPATRQVNASTLREANALFSKAFARIQALEAELARKTEALRPFAASEGEPEYKCRYCGDFSHNAHRCRAGNHDFEETGDEVHTFNKADIAAARSALEEKTDV